MQVRKENKGSLFAYCIGLHDILVESFITIHRTYECVYVSSNLSWLLSPLQTAWPSVLVKVLQVTEFIECISLCIERKFIRMI